MVYGFHGDKSFTLTVLESFGMCTVDVSFDHNPYGSCDFEWDPGDLMSQLMWLGESNRLVRERG